MSLVRKLSSVVQLGVCETECLVQLQSNPLHIKSGTELVHEGQAGHKAFIVHSGWARCYKHLPEGGRQIISFPLPGDVVGLGSILSPTSDQSCSVLTDAVVSSVDAKNMVGLFDKFPRLAAAILWAASRDGAKIIDRLVDVGRRSAVERVAHFVLELGERLQLVGLASEDEYECPLTQYDLADALGLSPIHVNRVLRRLREQELLTMKSRRVIVHNRARLKKLAGCDSGHLDHTVAALQVSGGPNSFAVTLM
jgi:CRP-like cAMP-binding protein